MKTHSWQVRTVLLSTLIFWSIELQLSQAREDPLRFNMPARHSTRETTPLLATNTPPWISKINDISLPVGTDSDLVPFSVGDAETPNDRLVLTATSSEPSLVWSGVDFAGLGTNRWLMVRPGLVTGIVRITIIVTDSAGASASTTFKLAACSAAPTLTSIADQTTTIGAPTAPIPFWVNLCRTVASWKIDASSSDTNLVPDGHLLVFGTGMHWHLVIIPGNELTGTAVITLTVIDGEGNSSSTSFTLHVERGSGPLTITSQPQGVTVLPEEPALLGVGVTSTSPPFFQWFADGRQIAGATNAFLALTNVQATTAGAYDVVITSGVESVRSQRAQVSVRAAVRLSVPSLGADGFISFRAFGQPGDRYSVFAASRVGFWQWVATLTNEVGSVEYRDKRNALIQFYGAALQP
jgi:hypothetical protein